MGLVIPGAQEPFQREGRVSTVWFKYLQGLTRTLNSTVNGIAAAVAEVADVYAATSGKTFDTGLIETASAFVALTDASPVAVNWDSGINFSLTVTANRQIGNPTNGQPGTYRTMLVQGNSTTDRTITFGNQFLGDVPAITDCDSAKWYLLTILCITSSHFVVSSKVAKT